MNRSLLWRGLLILAVVGVLAWSAYPLDEKLKLGLDLQGGMHLLLHVKVDDALRAETETDMDRTVRLLRDEARIPGATARRTSVTGFEILGVPGDADDRVDDIADDYLGTWTWRREGERLEFEMRDEYAAEVRRMAVAQARQTIDNRVNEFGVSEPVITTQPDKERIVVQLPGVDDPEQVKELIQSTAFLEFRLVDWPDGGAGASSVEEIMAHYGGRLPQTVEILVEEIEDPQTRQVVGERYYAVQKTSVITGRDLKNSRSERGEYQQPVVGFSVSPEGADRFGQATGENIGRGLAIILDGKVVSAPRINARITDRGIIEGSFTLQEVDLLVTQLRSGALPAGIEYLEERTVGASLGQDSIRQGLRAGLIGGTLVILTMLVVYKRTGINAVVALTLNVVLVFGALAYFRATLTLPGIAGIILTIGMAVDANVLVFERIREERRKGRTVRSAIAAGFEKARSSILDANITTLIAALFLFQFGTGPIRGFAVTLMVGIFSSMFTALFVSRWIFDFVTGRKGWAERLSI
ncbi:MAG TPA: protein translocase subunit SecD [Thermoanaerobaculia bacterium]|nr:protein translocase subunit SecD [Thermoanaerobaculia bacterium]